MHAYILGFPGLLKSDPSCIIKLVCNNNGGPPILLRLIRLDFKQIGTKNKSKKDKNNIMLIS